MSLELRPGSEKISVWPSKILIAQPHGFCAGIVRSLDASEQLMRKFPGQKGYYVGEPAHNEKLVDDFKARGVMFVENVSEVPDGNVVGLGPHGSTPEDLAIAKKKKLFGANTECPLVTKVHREADVYLEEGRTILYFAKEGHPETRGVLGHDTTGKRVIVFKDMEDLGEKLKGREIDPDKLAFASQTTHAANVTLAIQKEIREKFPNIRVPKHSDICYATQNRQDALGEVIKKGAEAIVVLGSKHSSNTIELVKLAKELGAEVHFADDHRELTKEEFLGLQSVGITSGASVPEDIFRETLDWFKLNGSKEFIDVSLDDVIEREREMVFKEAVIGQF